MHGIAMPPEVLQGRGFEPYPAGEIGTLFDWAENPGAASSHVMAHAGDFLVDVVEIEDNAVHQPSKPGDEVVLVLDGTLELTDDADGNRGGGQVRRFMRGEIVLIPKGWAGIYRCIAAERPFRELAIVPHDYFVTQQPAPTGRSPQRLLLPVSPGERHYHRGRYTVDAQGTGVAWAGASINAADEVIIITAGVLTLSSEAGSESFGAGSVVVLPRGLAMDGATSTDYQALALNWLE